MARPLTLHAHEIRRLLSVGGVTLWRPVKPQPPEGGSIRWNQFVDVRDGGWEYLDRRGEVVGIGHCPHGAPGDQQWCRETWGYWGSAKTPEWVIYRADGDRAGVDWRSPVTMPRWASRLSVVVQSVAVKRASDVKVEDAIALGWSEDCSWEEYSRGQLFPGNMPLALIDFALLWDHHNRKYPYATNPWTWVVTVRRMEE